MGLRGLVDSAVTFAQGAVDGAADLAAASLHALAHPTEAAKLARDVGAATQELTHIAMMNEDPPTALKGPLGTRKQVAWAEPIPLDDIKTIGKALGCTVNDVLLATVASVLGKHLANCGEDARGQTIRALVPVNLRTAAPAALGNHFGLVFANLPIGETNPIARLLAVHRDMEALKHSAQPVLALWLLTAMGLLPAAVEEHAIELFTKKASVVISNVPGPQHPMYLAGVRIDSQHFWVPQAGSIGVGVSILTYDGNVHFGLMADSKLIEAPRTLTRLFATEFEKLLLCTIAGALVTDRSVPSPARRTRASRGASSSDRKRRLRPAT